MLFFCVLFYSFIFFCGLLKAFHILREILLLYIWQIFGQTRSNFFFLKLVTRTDSLPCISRVFILKLSDCRQDQLSADFISDFEKFSLHK